MSAPAVVSADAAALALVHLPGMGPELLAAVLRRWPDPVAAVAAVASGEAGNVAREVGGDPARVRAWRGALDLDRAAARAAHRGVRALVDGTPGYPLADPLPDRPPVLLAEGSRPDALAAPRVAVVGTRAATPHGLDDATTLGRYLGEHGVTVVSGLAVGVDGAAHRGALDAGGLAVGVVATGLDVVYPRRHQWLFDRVRASGLLVGELPYGTPPQPFRFPVRNRIIAALADVVVVVEATERGGARITAEQALAYGRAVFAQPGSRRNPAAAGCNALVADGAQPLLDPSDVLLALGMTPGARRGWHAPDDRPAATGDARSVLRALGGEPATADQLVSRTGLTAPRVSVAVAGLERDRRVTRSRGMVWPA